ncbi:MAG: YkgJ family cysteine cluster protein [Syntrophobacteraceae bacterium]
MPILNVGDKNAPGYCNKCGLCCEVASGMPDFPAPDALPRGWREVFGNGLGRGHRFCAFLWEDNCSGGGFCSIYPLRSNPCRLFGSEECDFFWKSPEPVELSSGREILLIGLWLIKLVNPRKLPLVRTGITAKRPQFLEFDRI